MKALDLFPALVRDQAVVPDTSAWNVDLKLDTKADVERLLGLIDAAAEHAMSSGGPKLLEMAHGMASDLTSVSSREVIPAPTINLLRLIASSVAIDYSTHQKQFSVVRDWILFAIRGQLSTDQIIELDDLTAPQQAILGSSPATADFVRQPFLIWAWGLFYYSRVTGDLKPVASAYLGFVEHVCTAKMDELAVETLVYAGTWAAAVDDSRGQSILKRLAAILEKVPLPKAVAIQLSVALSAGVGQKAGLNAVQIAERALERFKGDLNAFDRLQLIAHGCSGNPDKVRTRMPELETAIRDHWSYVASHTQSAIVGSFERERSFDIIAPLVCTLASNSHLADAYRLTCLWRTGASGQLPRTAFLLPTWHQGTTFAAEGQLEKANSERMSDSLLEVTESANAFFGTNVVLRDDDRFVANEAIRPGIPDARPPASDKYESALTAHYRFDVIAPAAVSSQADQLLVIPQTRDPLQSLMLKTVGWSLPILASCAAPNPDRQIRRVCIWWASTNYGELEQRWVRDVFKNRGIDVVIPGTKSKEAFTAFYEGNGVDVMWMIGHGRFDHYYPERMSVDLSEVEELTFVDWNQMRLSAASGRRLFVANLCDSGTTAVLGGTGELGLPTLLARPEQALVAHLWPVSSMHTAIFGAVLAIELVKQTDFFAAYCGAVKVMISGRQAIETHLLQEFDAAHEIVQRLRGAPDIWKNLFVWGSPVFMS